MMANETDARTLFLTSPIPGVFYTQTDKVPYIKEMGSFFKLSKFACRQINAPKATEFWLESSAIVVVHQTASAMN